MPSARYNLLLPWAEASIHLGHGLRAERVQIRTFCLLPSAFCLLPSAFCLLPSAFCLLPSAFCLLPSAASAPISGSPVAGRAAFVHGSAALLGRTARAALAAGSAVAARRRGLAGPRRGAQRADAAQDGHDNREDGRFLHVIFTSFPGFTGPQSDTLRRPGEFFRPRAGQCPGGWGHPPGTGLPPRGGIRGSGFPGRDFHLQGRDAGNARGRQLGRAAVAGGAWLGQQRRTTVRRNAPGGGTGPETAGRDVAASVSAGSKKGGSGKMARSRDDPSTRDSRGLDPATFVGRHALNGAQQKPVGAGDGAGADADRPPVGGQQRGQHPWASAVRANARAASSGHGPFPFHASHGRPSARETHASQSRCRRRRDKISILLPSIVQIVPEARGESISSGA